MTSLPSDAELSRLFVLGAEAADIAAQYDVTPQAVYWRWNNMGLHRLPIAREVNQLIAGVWQVQSSAGAGSHWHSFPCQSLRYYLRLRMGDTLSERQAMEALRFERRLIREGAVLAYSKEEGFTYVPRTPEDGDLLIKWPDALDRPGEEEAGIWSLPDKPTLAPSMN
ncbi:hypothetical protein [Kitasatospora cineracea]|uniref:hypothetical protein n=1 Tax=Kitasatospora cineracea TaxID=88074 RepID=UPI00340E7BF1